MGYDIIGDIHGEYDKLAALLAKLGYRELAGAWRHPECTAIFVGDFIDRGRCQVKTVKTVRAMVDAGSALAVMGNHEFNAIAWFLPDPVNPGDFLRPRFSEKYGAKNRKQHAAFLTEVEHDPRLHKELIGWFLALPLWLELSGFKVIHACWHQAFIDYLRPRLRPGNRLDEELMVEATQESPQPGEDSIRPSMFTATEAILKGIEVPLPAGHTFLDKDDIERDSVRVRWWDCKADTYRRAALMSEARQATLPDEPIPRHGRVAFPKDVPIFVGHYWLPPTDAPQPLSDTVVCVDYSAGKNGPLVAYRWAGESPLIAAKFVVAGT